MSRRQSDYLAYRILGIVPNQELTHPNPTNFNNDEFVNSDGSSLDIHMIPKSLDDWEFVLNQNFSEIANQIYRLAIRTSLLYNHTGIQDPQAVANPGGALSSLNSGVTSTPPTYVYQNPNNDEQIEDPQVGDTNTEAIAQLISIIGRRSYTEDPLDGFTWADDQGRDGWWVSNTTTITHNIDEIDQLLGYTESTGFTDWETDLGNTYWNIKDYKDASDELRWSFAKNIELLNRSIGSREIDNRDWNAGRENELSAHVKAGYLDPEQTITDLINDMNNMLGNRAMQFPRPSAFGLDTEFAIHNEGSAADDTTFTSMISALNDAVGHRVTETNPTNLPASENYHILKDATGNDVTTMLNTLDAQIGNRWVADQGNHFPFRSSTGQTVTQWMNTTNVAFGDRNISNQGREYALRASHGGLGNTDDETMTWYVNRLNDAIGDQSYTKTNNHAIQIDGDTVTERIEDLNLAISDRVYTNFATTSTVAGDGDIRDVNLTDGETVTASLNQLNTVINTRMYTWGGSATAGTLVNNENITASLDALNRAIGNRDIDIWEASSSGYIYQGMEFNPAAYGTGATSKYSTNTLTDYLRRTAEQVGDRQYTEEYLTTSQTITASFQAIENRLNQIDGMTGTNTGDTSFDGHFSSTAEKFLFPAGGANKTLKQTLNSIGDKMLINLADYPMTSLVDGNGTETYTTSGWFDNNDAGTLRAVVQQLINRIDEITGWDA